MSGSRAGRRFGVPRAGGASTETGPAAAEQVARRWKVLAVTSVAVFMALLDVTIVNIAFPSIRESFPQDSLSDLSWILNGYNIVFAAALVPAVACAGLASALIALALGRVRARQVETLPARHTGTTPPPREVHP